jgi:hypothetical protein
MRSVSDPSIARRRASTSSRSVPSLRARRPEVYRERQEIRQTGRMEHGREEIERLRRAAELDPAAAADAIARDGRGD